jgi:5'-3' exonuclease
MGIPSYYKTLCDKVSGLLMKKLPLKPSHFWVDFNCIVYYCIRRPGALAYPGESGRVAWEDSIIEDVSKYLKHIVVKVGAPNVFVGVDGVVPMAKIRQQRLRRFKSVWTVTEEERIGVRPVGEPRWDTNAITPGTAFMERLGVALKKIKSPGIKWTVSAADEPGEGEHKVMRKMREISDGVHVVYGLDADLILLSLLQDKQVWLFRESMETGIKSASNDLTKKICGDLGDVDYSYFSIERLCEYICNGQDETYKFDYCMGMSLLGNDFLPHSMSVKLKENGHEILLSMLKEVRKVHGSLCSGGSWKKEALKACFKYLAGLEVALIEMSVLDKISRRDQRTRGSSSKEHILDEWNKTPLRLCDEMALIDGGKLRPDMPAVYYDRYLGINSSGELDDVCKRYLYGLQWICSYYTGLPIDQKWYFHWYLPPLWSDLADYLEKDELFVGTMPNLEPIKPQEQLALVLPLQSYMLVRDKTLKRLPIEKPQYWPSSFELFTAGHKQMWECEAVIPIIRL